MKPYASQVGGAQREHFLALYFPHLLKASKPAAPKKSEPAGQALCQVWNLARTRVSEAA